MRRSLLAAALFLGAVFFSPAHAGDDDYTVTPIHVIKFSPGGSIVEFIKGFAEIDAKHEKVVIDGQCLSACTLVLGTVDAANVCATNKGWFGFHSVAQPSDDDPSVRVFSADGTEMLWRTYPEAVQAVLAARGFDYTKEHKQLLFVKATELVQACP